MKSVTVKQMQKNLGQVIEAVAADPQPVIIKDGKDKVAVMMSMDEFRSWKETVYLLSSPKNAKRLRKTLAEMDRFIYNGSQNGR